MTEETWLTKEQLRAWMQFVAVLELLPGVLDAASRFTRRPSDEEMATMLDATRTSSLFGLPT